MTTRFEKQILLTIGPERWSIDGLALALRKPKATVARAVYRLQQSRLVVLGDHMGEVSLTAKGLNELRKEGR